MESNARAALGRYLAQIRKAVGIKQTELAKQLSLSIVAVSLIEEGEKEIPLEEAQRIAEQLGYDPNVVNLFYGAPVPPLTPDQKKLFTREAPPAAYLQRKA